MHESGVWALSTRNYVVTDPEVPPCAGCPTTPGGCGRVGQLARHATGARCTRTALVAIHSDEPRSGGQPMLALESGPAGSFPIN